MEQIVALKDQQMTGAAFKFTSHRLKLARSKSVIAQSIEVFVVLSSTQRTVHLFCGLDMTGLLIVVAAHTRFIWRMESESSATNRELTQAIQYVPFTMIFN